MIKEHILSAISSIVNNKMRSALSMLGIIIGVFAIIVMLALGQGATKSVVDRFNSMGANLITISPTRSNVGGVGSASRSSSSNIIDDKFVEYTKQIVGVKNTSVTTSSSKQFIYGTYNTNGQITGVEPNYLNIKSLTVENGSFITDENIKNVDKVIVIGHDLATNAFSTEDPIGKEVKLENMIFTVIGVLADNSQNNNKIFAPVSTVMKKISGSHYYSSIIIEVEDGFDVTLMKTFVNEELLKYLNISNAEDATFTVSSMSEMLTNIQQMTGTMTMLLAGIAAISLIVGGIGVMNIMLVSVTERTKEIGIRKAIGATKMDILTQFLIEALIISILAGVIGILLSFMAVAGINNFTTAVITPNSMYLSFFSVVFIGIVFGILPARKAASLKPIDALRFE